MLTQATGKLVWVQGVSQTRSDGKLMFIMWWKKEVQVHSLDEEDGIDVTEVDDL